MHLIKRVERYLIKRPFLLLIISVPFFWALIFSPLEVVRTWIYYPNNVYSKTASLFSKDKLAPIEEMRWDSFSDSKEDFFSRAYYNKATLLTKEFFDYLSYLSPEFYFQAGDGRDFSAKGVEPVSGFLFFFWIAGIASLVKNDTKKPFILALLFSFFAFLGNQKHFAFLFPVAVIYIYISHIGIITLVSVARRKYIYKFLLFYGVVIILRSFWLSLT